MPSGEMKSRQVNMQPQEVAPFPVKEREH